MAKKRTLTPRQMALQAAWDELASAKAANAITLQRLARARRRVEQLSRCDVCGGKTSGSGCEPQLCIRCSAERAQQYRLELLAKHGRGPDGKRLPKVAPQAAAIG